MPRETPNTPAEPDQTVGKDPADLEGAPSALDSEDTVRRGPDPRLAPAATDPDDAPAPGEEVNPTVARANRLEEIARARKDRQSEELDESRAAITIPQADVAEPEPYHPEELVELKIRGQTVRMSKGQRDTIVREHYGFATDDALADMSEQQRNRAAQVHEADKAYDATLAQKRAQLRPGAVDPAAAPATEEEPDRAAPPVRQHPQVQQPPKEDPITRAFEMVQAGEDPAVARAMAVEEFNRLATDAVDSRLAQRDLETFDQSFERDRDGAREQLEEKFPVFKNRVGRQLLDANFTDMQAEIISRHVESLPADRQEAFTADGRPIREHLSEMDPQAVDAVYRDFVRKGYGLDKPGAVMIATAGTVLRGLQPGANTPQPAPDPDPHKVDGQRNRTVQVDRGGRKDVLVQTPRAAIPRAPAATAKAPPPTEQERRAASRADLARREQGARPQG